MPALRVQAKKKTSGKDFTTRQTRINTMEEPMTSSPSWLSLSLAFRCLTILVFCFPLFARYLSHRCARGAHFCHKRSRGVGQTVCRQHLYAWTA